MNEKIITDEVLKNSFFVLEYSNIDEHWNAGVFDDLELAKEKLIWYYKEYKVIMDIIIYPKNTIFIYDSCSVLYQSRRISGYKIIPFEFLPEWAQKMKSHEKSQS